MRSLGVGQEALPGRGQDGFGVELNAPQRELAVRESHDLAGIGLSCDLELAWKTLARHGQRVVARGFEGIAQTGEQTGLSVRDQRSLAVHQAAGRDHGSTVRLTDRLVTQANAENRKPARVAADGLDADPRLVRGTGARRDHDRFGAALAHLAHVDCVIAHDVAAGAQLAQESAPQTSQFHK